MGWNTGERRVKAGPESLLAQSAFEDVGEVEVNDGYSVVSGQLMSPSEDEDCEDMVDTREPMRTPIKQLPPVLKRDLPLPADSAVAQTDSLPVIKVEGEGETNETATTLDELMSAHTSLEVSTTMPGVVSAAAPLDLAGYNNRSWTLDNNAADPSPGSELRTTHVVKMQPAPDLVSQARDKAKAMLKNIFPANKGDLMPNDALMPDLAGVMGHNMAWAQMNEKGEYVIDENPSESPVPSPTPSTVVPSASPSPGPFVREVMLPDRLVPKEEIADVAFEKELYLPDNALMNNKYSPAGQKLTMVRQPEGDKLIKTFQDTIPSVPSPSGRMAGNMLVQDPGAGLVGLGMGVQEEDEAPVKQDAAQLHNVMNHSPEIQRYVLQNGQHPSHAH